MEYHILPGLLWLVTHGHAATHNKRPWEGKWLMSLCDCVQSRLKKVRAIKLSAAGVAVGLRSRVSICNFPGPNVSVSPDSTVLAMALAWTAKADRVRVAMSAVLKGCM